MQQRHLRDSKKRAFRDRIFDLATVVAHDLGCRAIAILRANVAPPTRDCRFGSFRTNGRIEAELDLGRAIPEPQPVAANQSDPTFEGCCWTMFDINLDKIKADRKTS